jgi:hypothetical protein
VIDVILGQLNIPCDSGALANIRRDAQEKLTLDKYDYGSLNLLKY